jgi:predicted RNase H-like nuclease
VAALRGEVAEDSLEAAVHTRLRGARIDDVLDAIVAAWTARRIAEGSALVLGDPDQRDERGLRCTIVA